MKNIFSLPGMLLLALLVASSCKKEKAQEEQNDNELITTVELRITESGTNNSTIFKWEDIDGPGGEDPIIQPVNLLPNKLYNVQVAFIDASQNPPESITSEIVKENDVHRLYYEPDQSTGITVGSLDLDDNNLPLGLNCSWKTTGSGSGNMLITLRHYPNGGKEASDPVNSSKSNSDAAVEFPVIIAAP